MQVLEQSPKLLEDFAGGDANAFEALFRQFQHEIYAWIIRIVRDPSAAEDLTIETFWRIHRAHARFDPQRSFGAWARKIATNVALDHLKQAKTRTTLAGDSGSLDHLPAASAGDPVEQRDMRERAARAFHQLPASLRVVAVLALIEERSHTEIAGALNISTGAVKSRVFRAVALLRRKLKDLDVTYART
jgi:RNA polymerase sigma factor (sigma-70 family)